MGQGIKGEVRDRYGRGTGCLRDKKTSKKFSGGGWVGGLKSNIVSVPVPLGDLGRLDRYGTGKGWVRDRECQRGDSQSILLCEFFQIITLIGRLIRNY